MLYSSSSAVAAVVLSLLAGPSVAASNDPEVYYAIHYTGEGCVTEVGANSSAMSVVGYVTGTSNEVFGPPASDNMTCAAAIPCEIDPAWSADCTVEYTFNHTINEAGQVVNPQDPAYNMTECHVDDDWFGDCNWLYKTLDEIKAEPDLVLGNYQPDPEATNEFIYLAFYEDDSCTDLATIVTHLSGRNVSLPRPLNETKTLSCAEVSLCAVNPATGVCADRVDGGDFAKFKHVTRPESLNVYSCDTSNKEDGQAECSRVFTPTDCTQSSIYANCHFRYLSGDALGMNPRLLLGEVVETTEPMETTKPVETIEPAETTEPVKTTEPVDSSTSIAHLAGSRWLLTTLFSTLAVIVA